MDFSLYRAEALDAVSSQAHGKALIALPVSTRVTAVIGALLGLALGLYLVFGGYTRKVTVSGQLAPAAGAIKVVSPQFGYVAGRFVDDGDIVKTGQLLYQLSAERVANGESVDSRINKSLGSRKELLLQEREMQIQHLQTRLRLLHERNKLASAEQSRLGREITVQGERTGRSRQLYGRIKSLRKQGFVSDVQLLQFENELSDQETRKHALQRALLDTKAAAIQLLAEINETDAQLAARKSQIDQSILALDQELAEQRARTAHQVLATASGRVTALALEPGQAVQPGTALATIIPRTGHLEAHLLVPSSAIGFIQKHQSVRLRLAAFPYQKFGHVEGTVIRVEQSPLVEPTGLSNDKAEPHYRVIVGLMKQSVNAYQNEHQLKNGMTVEADVRQDRRRLIEWVLDPIMSVAKGHAN